MEWLDKNETMPSILASTFTGTIILAGDTNINVNEPYKFIRDKKFRSSKIHR